jgi:hypothetical protein
MAENLDGIVVDDLAGEPPRKVDGKIGLAARGRPDYGYNWVHYIQAERQ